MNIQRQILSILLLCGALLMNVQKSYAFVNNRMSNNFINAINSEFFMLAAFYCQNISFNYQGDSIDNKIDKEKFTDFAYYVINNPEFLSDSSKISICNYLIESNHQSNIPTDSVVADIYHKIGSIYINKGDTIRAREFFKKSIETYKTHNVYNENLISSYMSLGASMEITQSNDTIDDLLLSATIWDSCYSAYSTAKARGLIRDSYVPNDTDILFWAISDYVGYGLKQKWKYNFNQAERYFIRAMQLEKIRQQYSISPIKSLGDIGTYLSHCRYMRLQIKNGLESEDVFFSKINSSVPWEQFISLVNDANHYKSIGQSESYLKCLLKAHDLLPYINQEDTILYSARGLYYSFCINVEKRNGIDTLFSNDIQDAFRFFNQRYGIHSFQTIAAKIQYIQSLLYMDSPYISKAFQLLQSVSDELKYANKHKMSKESRELLEIGYNVCLMSYYSNLKCQEGLKCLHLAETDTTQTSESLSKLQDIFRYTDTIYSKLVTIYSKISKMPVYKQCIELQYTLPLNILYSAKFSHHLEDAAKYIDAYYEGKMVYWYHMMNLMTTQERETWLFNTNDADGIVFEIFEEYTSKNKRINQKHLKSAYNNNLFMKGLLLKQEQRVKDYVLFSNDTIVQLIYQHIQELKIGISNPQLANSLKLYLSQSIDFEERVLEETARDYRTRTIFQQPLTWKNIQKSLHKNEIALDFLNYNAVKYGAFILKHSYSSPKWILINNPHVQNLSTKQLIDTTFTYYNALVKSHSPIYATYELLLSTQDMQTLDNYRFLWNSVCQYVCVSDKVFYSPSGILYRVPLSTIPINDSINLNDLYDIHMVSSTENICSSYNEKFDNITLFGGIKYDIDTTIFFAKAKEQSFAMRDINFDNLDVVLEQRTLDRANFSYLPQTSTEVNEIAKLCDKHGIPSVVFSNEIADEETFKALSGHSPSILHIATHGYYITPTQAEKISQERLYNMGIGSYDNNQIIDYSMDRTGLLLAGAKCKLRGDTLPDGLEDGVLTANEISRLDLSNTDLVVLSACQTGLGDITSDGIAGLQRGFKMAGVKSILMSLWNVDDQATYLLMTQFYKHLLSGESKYDALRSAQRYVKNYEQDGEKIFADFKYWAGFVLLD